MDGEDERKIGGNLMTDDVYMWELSAMSRLCYRGARWQERISKSDML